MKIARRAGNRDKLLRDRRRPGEAARPAQSRVSPHARCVDAANIARVSGQGRSAHPPPHGESERMAEPAGSRRPRRRRRLPAHDGCVFALAVGARRVVDRQSVAAAVAAGRARRRSSSSRATSSSSSTPAISLGRMVVSLAHRRARSRFRSGSRWDCSRRFDAHRRSRRRAAAADLRHRVDSARAVHLRHRQRAAGVHHDLRGVLPDPARHGRRRAHASTGGWSTPRARWAFRGATIVTRVVVPAALPALLVALRLGVASSWTAVVAAELIGAPSGLGYADRVVSRAADDAAGDGFIAMIGVLGYLCDAARALAQPPAHAVGARRADDGRARRARDAGGARPASACCCRSRC